MIERTPIPPLFAQARPASKPTAEQSIDEAFRAFDRANPDVFRKFRELAEQIRASGWTRYSADALLHRIRWHYHVEKGDRAFLINDHWSSRYARLLIDIDPSFQGFFELRRLRSRAREERAG